MRPVVIVLIVVTPLLAVWRAWRWTVERSAPRLSVTKTGDDQIAR